MHTPLPVYETEKVASTNPRSGRKKSWIPRLACSLLSAAALVGLSDASPSAVEVNMRAASLTNTVEFTASPELGRNGVT